MNLKGRNFLTLKDFTPEEIVGLVDLAAEYKQKKKQGILHDTLRGKNIAIACAIDCFLCSLHARCLGGLVED